VSMAEHVLSGARPLNVFVKSGSKAELSSRRVASRSMVAPKEAPPQMEVIATGFQPRPELNLHDRGGKIIQDLVYTNFFVGGNEAWDPQDIQLIDLALSKAMSDQRLNNVLLQYFRGAASISSTFRPSVVLSSAVAGVETMLKDLQANGALNGFPIDQTVFNFMLPRATVLTLGNGAGAKLAGDGASEGAAPIDEKVSSLEGLGGFHGSVHIGAITLYYAVGVFSEGQNGIVAFDQPWKNVVATFYHELVEARTDADVEDNQVAWVNNEHPGEEIGDIPMTLAGSNLGKVMKEVQLADGSGTAPIQLMWSNAVQGPEGPIAAPHPPTH
jgi:hypothetical protein